jgi:hypothetical protein
MHTFGEVGKYDDKGNALGVPLGGTFRTADGARTVDSTGAFFVGELERLDQTTHPPLTQVTWGRDIDLREDVSIADEVSSFTQSNYGAVGGAGTGNGIGNGKAWIGKDTTAISGISVDLAKIAQPLRPWGMELKYTVMELASSAKLGRPIDQQKYDGLQLKHQMDTDEQIYIGDLTTGDPGLLTSGKVTPTNLPNGAAGSSLWTSKTPDEILADVNFALTTVWQTAAWAVLPTKIIIPPADLGYISMAKVSDAGNVSILKYVLENNILAQQKGASLDIVATKWNIGTGVGGTIGVTGTHNRMIVYSQDKQYVRYPMTMLARTPIEYRGIYQIATYYCKLGVMEFVYPETIGYFDGL